MNQIKQSAASILSNVKKQIKLDSIMVCDSAFNRSIVPPVCSAAKRNPWFAQNIHATNFLCSIELICLICWLKIVMIIYVSFCTTEWSAECG